MNDPSQIIGLLIGALILVWIAGQLMDGGV